MRVYMSLTLSQLKYEILRLNRLPQNSSNTISRFNRIGEISIIKFSTKEMILRHFVWNYCGWFKNNKLRCQKIFSHSHNCFTKMLSWLFYQLLFNNLLLCVSMSGSAGRTAEPFFFWNHDVLKTYAKYAILTRT